MAFIAPRIAKQRTERLIFGCGNFFYPRARHSVGLLTVNRMAKVLKLPEWRLKKEQLCWYTGGSDFHLVRPRAYPIIDISRSLRRSMNFFDIESSKNVTIIHHDPSVPIGEFYATFGDIPPHIPYLNRISAVLKKNDFHHIGIGIRPLEGEKLYLNHTLRSLVEQPMNNTELEECYEHNKLPDHQLQILEERVFNEEAIKAMIYAILNPMESFKSAEDIFPMPELPPGEPSYSEILGALKMGSQDLFQK